MRARDDRAKLSVGILLLLTVLPLPLFWSGSSAGGDATSVAPADFTWVSVIASVVVIALGLASWLTRFSLPARASLRCAAWVPAIATSLPYSAWADAHPAFLAVSAVVWVVGLSTTIAARAAHVGSPQLSGR